MTLGIPVRIEVYIQAKVADLSFDEQGYGKLTLRNFKTQGAVPMETLFYPPELTPVLRRYLEVLQHHFPGAETPLFPSLSGQTLTSLHSSFQELGKELFGIARFGSHIIRDSFITEVVNNGRFTSSDIDVLAECMLVSTNTLTEHYTHILGGKFRVASVATVQIALGAGALSFLI